jgi:hypothetical protein
MMDPIHMKRQVLKEIETCDGTLSRATNDSWPIGTHYKLNVYLTHLRQED